MYDDVSKFVFGFPSEASHQDNNVVETANEDLYNLLKLLSEGDYLRNTLVILMGDRAARFISVRSSLQENQEEQLPFSGFHFQNGLNQNTAKRFKILD